MTQHERYRDNFHSTDAMTWRPDRDGEQIIPSKESGKEGNWHQNPEYGYEDANWGNHGRDFFNDATRMIRDIPFAPVKDGFLTGANSHDGFWR